MGLSTLKLMIISFYKRNAIIDKWETTPGLHQPLWAWSIPTGPAFGTVPANDAAGRCPGQAPYRRRGCSAPQGSNCWQLPGIMFCFIKLKNDRIIIVPSKVVWWDIMGIQWGYNGLILMSSFVVVSSKVWWVKQPEKSSLKQHKHSFCRIHRGLP